MEKLWALVVDVWTNGYAGIDFGRYIIGLGIFSGFLIIRQLFTRFILHRIELFTQKTKNDLDRKFVVAIRRPISFIPVVIGLFISVEYLQLTGEVQGFFEQFIRSLIIFTFFWTIYRLVGQFSYLIFGSRRLNQKLHDALLNWISNLLKVLLIVIGAASILEIWGINIGTLIAGFGLFGVAVALGAQDMFKNLIAGILILAEGRFKNGDWIKVEGVAEGTVENIGFRSTRIRRFDKAPVVLPNASLSDNPVINFSEMTYRRIYWVLGVEYSTSTDQLKKIRDEIELAISDPEIFVSAQDAAKFVRIDSFNDSSIDIMLYCFTQTKDWGEWLKIKEALAFKIKQIVEDAGTGFAFPSTSLYVEEVSKHSERPEDISSKFVGTLIKTED